MKLVGVPLLADAIEALGDPFAWRAAAWAAEARYAHWRSDAEFGERYPDAVRQGDGRFEIPLGETDCVAVTLNYKKEVALITRAGRRVKTLAAVPLAGHRTAP